MTAVIRWVVIVAAAGVVVATWRRSATGEVGRAEERFFRRFNDAPDAVHLPVWAVMQAGSFAAVWVVTAVLAIDDRNTETVAAAVVGTVVWAGVKRVKHAIGRGRPAAHLAAVNVRGQAQTGLGYPSGHSAVSMSLALIATDGADPLVQTVGVAVALVVGGARMYVGAHLPLDVAGGLAIGVAIGQITVLGMAL